MKNIKAINHFANFIILYKNVSSFSKLKFNFSYHQSKHVLAANW